MNLVQHLVEQGLITPPPWLASNTHYLTIMGSIAYGVADTNDDAVQSDFDLYGFCIPGKEVVFPHLAGHIWGFGKYKDGMPKNYFGQYQNHHVHDASARNGKGRDYDLQIYNIVKYFRNRSPQTECLIVYKLLWETRNLRGKQKLIVYKI